MADQQFTGKFVGNPEEGSIRFSSTGSESAAVDRIFAEGHRIPRLSTNPRHATAAIRSLGYTHGQAHPEDPYCFLVGAEMVGVDDNHEQWQTLWRVDMKAYCAAAGLSWPNLLSKDKTSIGDEWGDGSTVISWRFDVLNPDSYTRPAWATAHPDIPTAVLVGESKGLNGKIATVSRRYQKLPELVDWEVDPESRAPVRVSRQIVATVLFPGVPVRGIDQSQHALGTAFSLRTTRMIANGGIPTGYAKRRLVVFDFPSILIRFDQFQDVTGEIRHSPIIRDGFSKQVSGRVLVDFHRSEPSPSAVFKIQPISYQYPGVTFQLSLSGVLTDGQKVWKSSTDYYEETTLPISTPTARSYLSSINQERLVAETISEWRFGLFRRERIYIRLE